MTTKPRFKPGDTVYCLCLQDVEPVVVKSVHKSKDGVWTYVVQNQHFLGGRDDEELYATEEEAREAKN